MNPENYVRDIELGNEVQWGQGETTDVKLSGKLN